MDATNIWAFLAYLLSIFGSLYVYLFRRQDRFAVYHASQSVALFLFTVGLLLGWFVAAFVLAWIPVAGAVLGFSLFALVMAGWVMAFIIWIVGMSRALRSVIEPLPLIGRWGERLPVERWFIKQPPVTEVELQKPV